MTTPSAAQTISIEVCAAWPDRVVRQRLTVPAGVTLTELKNHPDLSAELTAAWSQASGVGVFGEPKPLDEPLADGDRVELWRPLVADPKDARRQRAKLKLQELKKARLAQRQKARSGSV